MEIITKDSTIPGQNSDICKTIEYSFQNKNIDLGIATITGRFPAKGYAKNLVSAELVYIIEGEGTINFQDKSINYQKGDAILIEPNEKYFYETTYTVATLTCTPAWNPNQHVMED